MANGLGVSAPQAALRHIDTWDTDMPLMNATTDELRQHIIDSSEPVTESGCWIWMRAPDQDGYGLLQVQGKSYRAHRLSYEIFNGRINGGLHVLHKCDVPPCVNPAHLWLGTNRDNAIDRNKKNRHGAKGERHGMARLTGKDVIEIRNRYASGGVLQRELAAEFGVSIGAIGHAIRRELWRDV